MVVADVLKGILGAGTIEQSSLKPLILLSSDDGTLGVNDLLNAVEYFKSEDDVFFLDFLTDSIVIQSSATVQLGVENLNNLKTSLGPWTVKSLFTLQSDADRPPLPPMVRISSADGISLTHGGYIQKILIALLLLLFSVIFSLPNRGI